jgi:hypothetical protein
VGVTNSDRRGKGNPSIHENTKWGLLETEEGKFDFPLEKIKIWNWVFSWTLVTQNFVLFFLQQYWGLNSGLWKYLLGRCSTTEPISLVHNFMYSYVVGFNFVWNK